MNLDLSNAQLVIILVLAAWDLVWRGYALWRAAHLNARNWFIVLLIVNSVGILPIIYLYNTKEK